MYLKEMLKIENVNFQDMAFWLLVKWCTFRQWRKQWKNTLEKVEKYLKTTFQNNHCQKLYLLKLKLNLSKDLLKLNFNLSKDLLKLNINLSKDL